MSTTLLAEITDMFERMRRSDEAILELVEGIERKLERIEGQVGIPDKPALQVVPDEETPC